MKPPVIVLLGPSLDALSGVSTHLQQLMGSRLAQGFSFSHFQVGSEGRQESRLWRFWRLITSPLRLALHLRRTQASLLHINTSLNPRAYWRDLAYLLVARLCGVAVVYQIHGGELPRDFMEGHPLRQATLYQALALPDAIVLLARCELKAYQEFVPEQLLLVIPNAIELPPEPETHTGSNLVLRLIYIGRLDMKKGLNEALTGLAEARAAGYRVELVLAGDGPDRNDLQARCWELGIQESVIFHDPVFGADKLKLLNSADALLMPTYSEGLPYTLLEAMAAGLPPITTPVGAIPDVVSDGIHGLLVPPRDAAAVAQAIQTLADYPSQRLAMGDACRRRIAHAYTVDRLAADFGQLYQVLWEHHQTGRTERHTLRPLARH